VANFGLTGWVAWYCLTKIPPCLVKISNAMNNATKAQLLQLLVHPKFPDEAKPQAQSIVNDIEHP